MKFKIQCFFNNQKWSNELKRLNQVKTKLSEYSKGRLDVEFLPSIYTTYKNIPAVIEMFPFTNETAENVDPKWYLENIYSQRPDADALVFITNREDWWDKNMANGGTYAYCRGHHPATFPHFISAMAESSEKSWNQPHLYALEHYIPHELGHAFCQITGLPDTKVHELDYAGKIQELYDLFDYDKIEFAIKHKRSLNESMIIIKKKGDGTLYFLVGKTAVPFSNTYEGFLADFKDAVILELDPDEFLKLKIANHNVVKARN